MKKLKFTRSAAVDWTVMTLATVISSVGVYFFTFANKFSFGGVSGLSLLLANIFQDKLGISWLTPSLMTNMFNVVLLIIGFIVLGREFGVKTVYCTVLFSGLLMLFPLFKLDSHLPFTVTEQNPQGNMLLELIFAVLLQGGAAALLFNRKASTGGSDIIALIIRKKFGLEPGRALLVCDAFVVAGAFFVFGIPKGLLCLLGLIMKSLIIDNLIASINRSKYFLIITTHPEPVREFVTEHLHRGATYWKCEGAYTHGEKYAIIAIMKGHQAKLLREKIKSFDEHAFIIVMNTSDIMGKGFRTLE